MGANTIMAGGTVARMMIENIPDDIRNRFKSRCALYETPMREDIIRYMDARGGNVETMKPVIAELLTQLVDELASKTECRTIVSIQDEFMAFAFPDIDDDQGSIAGAPIDHIPEEYREYESQRLMEIEAETGKEATSRDFDLIEKEWEKIEERREELREEAIDAAVERWVDEHEGDPTQEDIDDYRSSLEEEDV